MCAWVGGSNTLLALRFPGADEDLVFCHSTRCHGHSSAAITGRQNCSAQTRTSKWLALAEHGCIIDVAIDLHTSFRGPRERAAIG